MQNKTGIFFFVTIQLFIEATRISMHIVEIFSGDLCPGETKLVLFLNLWPSTVIQGLSDNRYFTAVGFFLRDLNAKHQFSHVQQIKIRSRFSMG